MTPAEERAALRRIHDLRMKAHWGNNYDASCNAWPQSDTDWRQTDHGAPWDTNVYMAKWHRDFARKLQSEGLI